jgi:hypothetical protein
MKTRLTAIAAAVLLLLSITDFVSYVSHLTRRKNWMIS